MRGLARLISSAIRSWQKTGPLDEAKRPPPGLRFLEDLRSQNVRRHEIGRELHAPLLEAENRAQGLDEARLAQPRNPDQQDMSPGEQGDDGLLDDLVQTEDDPADLVASLDNPLPQGLDGVDKLIGRTYMILVPNCGCHGGVSVLWWCG